MRLHMRAASLVELLAVMAVVAIVAAIVLPVMAGVRSRSQHTACASNLRQIGVAIHLYAQVNDGFVPPATTAESTYLAKGAPPGEVRASPAVLRLALDSNLASGQVWFCPGDGFAGRNQLWMGQRHLLSSYRVLPFDVEAFGYMAWPPRMRLMRDAPASFRPGDDVPLVSDAAGFWKLDPELPKGDHAVSNHGDGWVNFVRHDLSLARTTADRFCGL